GKMDIMAELHSLWTPLAAERVLRALAPFQPFWVEDPIKMTNADMLASLRARTGVPICASETIATRRAFREFLEADAVDVVMLDLSWCGGVGEAKKIASLAEAWWHRTTARGPWYWSPPCTSRSTAQTRSCRRRCELSPPAGIAK